MVSIEEKVFTEDDDEGTDEETSKQGDINGTAKTTWRAVQGKMYVSYDSYAAVSRAYRSHFPISSDSTCWSKRVD